MGWILAVCCLSIACIPSLLLFCHFVASDPLRITLFVLGAFFWLCSLLLSSIVFAIFGPRFLLVAEFSSILFQELARVLYIVLLYKAQGGLARLMAADTGRTGTASSMRLLYSFRHISAIVGGLKAQGGLARLMAADTGRTGTASSMRLLYSSRHNLAIVWGLGMGTAAALFRLANVLAAHLDDCVVGLTAANTNSTTTSPHHQSAFFSDNDLYWSHESDSFFPLYYSVGAALLTFYNVVWTVIAWDAYHRYFYAIGRFEGRLATGAFTPISHFVNSVSNITLNIAPVLVLAQQSIFLAVSVFYAYLLIK